MQLEASGAPCPQKASPSTASGLLLRSVSTPGHMHANRIRSALMSSAALTENAIGRWHEVVNSKDLDGACRAVSDPIVVNGPKGVGPITPAGFADWITRSGIEMRAKSWHPINDRVMVVEQEARWPQSKGWSRLATVFRATDDRVSAALRFPDLRAALTFAYLCAELAATE